MFDEVKGLNERESRVLSAKDRKRSKKHLILLMI